MIEKSFAFAEIASSLDRRGFGRAMQCALRSSSEEERKEIFKFPKIPKGMVIYSDVTTDAVSKDGNKMEVDYILIDSTIPKNERWSKMQEARTNGIVKKASVPVSAEAYKKLGTLSCSLVAWIENDNKIASLLSGIQSKKNEAYDKISHTKNNLKNDVEKTLVSNAELIFNPNDSIEIKKIKAREIMERADWAGEEDWPWGESLGIKVPSLWQEIFG